MIPTSKHTTTVITAFIMVCAGQVILAESGPLPEVHLTDIRQLTFGGENAEAYWSPDGTELIFQATAPPYACDQILRLKVDDPSSPQLVSTGEGRTTCAYFGYPAADRIIYSSTHETSIECPPTPDRSQGYVWPIYDSYEIYSAKPDGSDLAKLTENSSYDAEATVCPVDGSIIFTSTRDNDLELYRMDSDGGNLQRLTQAPGYDGGAFFSSDCSQIVWRASRPSAGKSLDEYQDLLSRGLVRPSKLELWVAASDGTHARQVTYLDAASFAPYFFPNGKRIIFSSNHGDPSGREFELWAINVDGTGLERITHSPEFDGFPVFSPDGKYLAFASNRNHSEPGETNLFVARWVDGDFNTLETGLADSYQADVAWLAQDDREGRGIGTNGLIAAASWIEQQFAAIGLEPAGEDGYRQDLEVPYEVRVGNTTLVTIDDQKLDTDSYRPMPFSASGTVSAEVVSAGYGITAPDLKVDDYADLNVKDKIVIVRRFVPADPPFDDATIERRYGDIRYKAFNAREHGAVGLLIVDLPDTEELEDEAAFPSLRIDTKGNAGIPVVVLNRASGSSLFSESHQAQLTVEVIQDNAATANLIGVLRAGAPDKDSGSILLGAHYDHLGYGGSNSLAPDSTEIHNGADDNASGTAALLAAARTLAASADSLQRDVYFAAFTGEETGVFGSTRFTRSPPSGIDLSTMMAMINMDMVGRLSNNRLSVLGSDSAEEWEEIIGAACDVMRLDCKVGGDGYGPSDHTSFYAAGVPVVHLFSGVHDDYHKPSDDAAKINAGGGAQIALLAADLASRVAAWPNRLTYKEAPPPPPDGDVRSFGASLGTVPDYSGPGVGIKGVLLSGVREGSPAKQAGMQRGDLLVELAGKEIGDIYDFVFILRNAKPGDTVTAVVERDKRRVELVVTFGVSRRRI